MTIQEYQDKALTTLSGEHGCEDLSPKLLSQILGLVGESGEVAEKFKKIIRDNNGALSSDDKQSVIKELGDIVWYVNSIAHLLDSNLEEVMQGNLEKVLSRKQRGVISGSGDER